MCAKDTKRKTQTQCWGSVVQSKCSYRSQSERKGREGTRRATKPGVHPRSSSPIRTRAKRKVATSVERNRESNARGVSSRGQATWGRVRQKGDRKGMLGRESVCKNERGSGPSNMNRLAPGKGGGSRRTAATRKGGTVKERPA